MARPRNRPAPNRRTVVSARFLFEGFWYAVEQSGRLLHTATFLYDAGRFDVAAGFALLGIEELGKGRLLRDFWKEGKPVELGRVNATLEDHPRKFKAGQTLFSLTAGLAEGRLLPCPARSRSW